MRVPITPQYDESGRWLPKSSYFKWLLNLHRRKIVVQQEPDVYKAQLAFCTACGAAYLYSEGVRYEGDEPAEEGNDPLFVGGRARPHSPCHGTEPLLTYDLEGMFNLLNLLAEQLHGGAGAPPELPGQEPPTHPRPERRRGATGEGPASPASESVAPPADDPSAPDPAPEPVAAAVES